MRKVDRAYAKTRKQHLKLITQEMRERDRWVTKRYGSHGHAACGKKQRYDTRLQAERTVDRAINENCHKTELKVYQCPFCGGWHVSHRPADQEFWERYVTHAQMHLQRKLESLEPNAAKSINLDYTKTKALAKLREWDAEHNYTGPLTYQTHRCMKASRKLQQERQLEVDLEEMIVQEAMEP